MPSPTNQCRNARRCNNFENGCRIWSNCFRMPVWLAIPVTARAKPFGGISQCATLHCPRTAVKTSFSRDHLHCSQSRARTLASVFLSRSNREASVATGCVHERHPLLWDICPRENSRVTFDWFSQTSVGWACALYDSDNERSVGLGAVRMMWRENERRGMESCSRLIYVDPCWVALKRKTGFLRRCRLSQFSSPGKRKQAVSPIITCARRWLTSSKVPEGSRSFLLRMSNRAMLSKQKVSSVFSIRSRSRLSNERTNQTRLTRHGQYCVVRFNLKSDRYLARRRSFWVLSIQQLETSTVQEKLRRRLGCDPNILPESDRWSTNQIRRQPLR